MTDHRATVKPVDPRCKRSLAVQACRRRCVVKKPDRSRRKADSNSLLRVRTCLQDENGARHRAPQTNACGKPVAERDDHDQRRTADSKQRHLLVVGDRR